MGRSQEEGLEDLVALADTVDTADLCMARCAVVVHHRICGDPVPCDLVVLVDPHRK